jgi:hypothetical protein
MNRAEPASIVMVASVGKRVILSIRMTGVSHGVSGGRCDVRYRDLHQLP